MERTEKIGFAEWCAEYRKTLPESKRDYRIGDFLSDIDSDLLQNPFMAGCCVYTTTEYFINGNGREWAEIDGFG